MSERRKRKEDTWTKEELSAALHKNNDQSNKREKSSRHSGDKPRERKSKHHDLERMLDEHEESVGRKKPKDPELQRERAERKRREAQERDEAERRARKKLEKERRLLEEDLTRKDKKQREGDRKHRDSKHKERRKVEEEPVVKQRSHRERSEKNRSEEYEADKEKKRRERKEEKRRRHEKEEEERKYNEKQKHRRNQGDSDTRNDEVQDHTQSTRSKHKSKTSEKKDAEKEENEEYNYEDDDFEDYEDDFEDEGANEEDFQDSETNENTSEMNAIIRAINEENERVASARTISSRSEHKPSTPSDEEGGRSSHSSFSSLVTTNINFSTGRGKRQGGKLHRKILKRHRDLAALIQLDFVSIDCFELAPVTEYNFYIKSFGGQNTRQVSTQCNDDSLEVDVQTEAPDTNESWTQHPQDGPAAAGSSSRYNADSGYSSATSLSMMEDTRSFSHFLQYADELVESSFMETTMWGGLTSDRRSPLSFCDSCTRFNTNISYLQGRNILLTAFCNGAMAVAFGPATQHFSARVDRKCLITVWKITDSENPNKVLVCDSVPTSCCLSPSNQHHLLVGTDDGCVLAYDLSEPSTMHQKLLLEKKKTNVFRSPTYTTGWRDDLHSSPIVALHPLTPDGSTNQIYSLEENSRICVWLIADVVSDVDDDVGLVPHGRIKLVRGMVIDVESPEISTCVQCPDSKTFYVGTEGGSIVSVTRDQRKRVFESNHVGAVISIAFNPSANELMLTGHQDGSLCLFHIAQATPLMTWNVAQERIVACDWSNCRSSVFVALDSTNHIHVWDLMAIDSAPAVSCKALSLCVDQLSKKSTSLLFAFEKCDFEVHRLSSHFTDLMMSDETENMTSSILMFA